MICFDVFSLPVEVNSLGVKFKARPDGVLVLVLAQKFTVESGFQVSVTLGLGDERLLNVGAAVRVAKGGVHADADLGFSFLLLGLDFPPGPATHSGVGCGVTSVKAAIEGRLGFEEPARHAQHLQVPVTGHSVGRDVPSSLFEANIGCVPYETKLCGVLCLGRDHEDRQRNCKLGNCHSFL